jgi:hypothetical protein
MIASLGMYDLPQMQAANDRFWVLIRDGLRRAGQPAPESLTRGTDAYWPAWTSPDLVLSQTCGLPYRARFHGKVTLIGTPDYGLDGCPPGHYRSLFVARTSDTRKTLADFQGATLAYNEDLSQSGWAAPSNHVAGTGLVWSGLLRTGAHIASSRAVADGRADLAAIDALTWELLKRYEEWPTQLSVIEATAPTPALPYIARAGADADLLFDVVTAAIAVLPADDREVLHLRGFVRVPAGAYLAVPNPPAPEAVIPTT